ncbi:hypothetical protein LTR24_000878 [Lithohypha guttulata]|uniref:Xylanolytic transcriptional activator regulatory domain-containing protein n=1 Tax=Lithohypha guttulata TaxID=1690604 RepID=A0ABR0KNF8_9EURO|nr:hypothetical protein LTR24_000878 [Lithohypha guttulata]
MATNTSSSPSTTIKSETASKARNIWQAMNQGAGYMRSSCGALLTEAEQSRDTEDDDSDSSSDDVRETMVNLKKNWDYWHQSNVLLFGSRNTAVDLPTLHPQQIQIFRLWQVYLDNVNPLLKVTHTPTLQGSIIDAATNVTSIKPALAALMFSIYSVSILSLVDSDCLAMFGSSKEELLKRYQFGCQQALLDCEFLRSTDRDCLTALYLYLISARPSTDPDSLSTMLGLAIRTAQRMGLHLESTYAKCPALEAEMRRRLWWSLVLFDTRICEMAVHRSLMLTPTWDCKPPLNVNDFDLRPEMKGPPTVQVQPTEALFAVVRSEMGEFVRHSAFHLDLISPALKNVAKNIHNGPIPDGGELVTLEKAMEDNYLKYCNLENPLHFMTCCMTRSYLAKNRLIEHYSRSSTRDTDAQRDAALSLALEMLQCDTQLMTSPLTKGYHWYIHFHFPFPAYIHITQDLRRRPASGYTERAWEIINDNFEARFQPEHDLHFFKIYAAIVIQGWKPPEQAENTSAPPRVVSELKRRLAQMTQEEQIANTAQADDVVGMNIDDVLMSMPMPMDFGSHGMAYGMGGQGYEGWGIGAYSSMQGQMPIDMNTNQPEWNGVW